MLTVPEALALILEAVAPLPGRRVALADALGLSLAEEATADIDSPPFDKSMMDGFAVRSEDLAAVPATLNVIEVITAGMTPSLQIGSGQAAQIMTGAPLPEGADAVVRIEDATLSKEGDPYQQVVIQRSVPPGENIVRKGTSCRAGSVILERGRELRPQELGALAEMGCHQLAVYPRPRVAVLATGDELVPIDRVPGPGQIRNSNETMLVAQIANAGGTPVPLGIARDERSHLRERIDAGLGCDVLLLSGGVSAGTLDLVPSELQSAGVRQVFHKVNVKPGKPVWFGVLDATGDDGGNGAEPGRPTCLVFGLPGNPVSSMVCFELFVRTALRRLMGVPACEPALLPARLTGEHHQRGDRLTYHPSHLSWGAEGLLATPVPWGGSSDLLATVAANGMAVFPPGERRYAAGEVIDVVRWE